MSPIKPLQDCIQNDLLATNRFILDQINSDIPLVQEVSEYLINNGGKRIRPRLALLTSAALGYQGEDRITLATIVEFIHTASLFHDDVIDHSELRRGKITANKIWDNSTSVLVGDFLYSRASELIATLKNHEINQVLARATNELTQGEILQLLNVGKMDITIEQYLAAIKRKTAYLFAAATQTAAILAGASVAQQTALYHYGLNIGIAFQLVDDLLDYQGSEKSLGKTPGNDLLEGKVTLPIIYALEHAEPQDVAVVKKAIEEKNILALEAVQTILLRTQAKEYTLKQAKNHVDLALENVSSLPKSVYRDALWELAESSLTRSS